MSTLINFLSRYIANFPGISLLVFVCILCFLVFKWRADKLNLGAEGNSQLLDSRFWYSPTDVKDFFDFIGKKGRNLYAQTQLTLDVIFPITYGTLLATLITLVYSAEIAQGLIIIPILAVVADLGENFILAGLASNYSGTVSSIAWVASVFTLLKWVMAFCSVLLILGGIIGKFKIS